jgi:heme exporter protein D
MYFDSMETLLSMDGHGVFVWTAYLITMVVIAGILIAPLRRKRKFLLQLAGELKRTQAQPGNSQEDV